jgi:hypothetical protein
MCAHSPFFVVSDKFKGSAKAAEKVASTKRTLDPYRIAHSLIARMKMDLGGQNSTKDGD